MTLCTYQPAGLLQLQDRPSERSREFRGAKRSKMGRTIHTVAIANGASRYARLARCTAIHPHNSARRIATASHRIPSLRESHEKPAVQQPSLFYRR